MNRHFAKLGGLFQNLVNFLAEGIFFVAVALFTPLSRFPYRRTSYLKMVFVITVMAITFAKVQKLFIQTSKIG